MMWFSSQIGGLRKTSDPERAAKPAGGVIGLCTIVIDKDTPVAPVAKQRAAEFSDSRRRGHPAGGFQPVLLS
jgi:hypothetical protein